MYSELERLVRTIVTRVCKEDVWPADAILPQDIFDNVENLLSPENIVVGNEISAELDKVKDAQRLNFLNNARKHYIASCKHVLTKAGIRNAFIKHCRCLAPSNRKSSRSSNDIQHIAKSLSLNIKTDLLMDEWNLLRCEADANGSENLRIESYWNQFFIMKTSGGEMKYPLVMKIVTAALTVSHGNADVERGFSTSGRILTDDRSSMCERTLNSLMHIKSALRAFGNKPHLVPIPKELIKMAHTAHGSYKNYLEEQRRQKEEENELRLKEIARAEEEEKSKLQMNDLKSSIEKKEEELKVLRKDEDEKRRTADKLFLEANTRLKKAIETRNMAEVELAQAMLEGVSTVRKQQSSQKRAADQVQDTVEKKKARLITGFFAKKPKN